jgi:hypothetical protein
MFASTIVLSVRPLPIAVFKVRAFSRAELPTAFVVAMSVSGNPLSSVSALMPPSRRVIRCPEIEVNHALSCAGI